MLIPDAYLRLEKKKGCSLSDIGFTDVAFMRKDILEALESLKGSQVAVLGGEAMEIVNGKIQHQHTYDNWSANKRPEEDIMDYIERSMAEAERYIRSYTDPEDGTILYSPTISELGVGSTWRR
jgi:hypothetical protein